MREYIRNGGAEFRRDCEMLVMQYQSLVNVVSSAIYKSHFDAAAGCALSGNPESSQTMLNEMEPDKMRIMVYKYADEIYKEQIAELIKAIHRANEIN